MLKLKSARQSPLVASLLINFDDPTAYGSAEDAFEVPANAVLIGGDITVLTAWNSGTTATLSLGDAGSSTRYASAVDLKTAGRTLLTFTGYKHTTTEKLKALFAQTGTAATAGKARVRVEYFVEGRSTEVQGLDSRGPGLPGA